MSVGLLLAAFDGSRVKALFNCLYLVDPSFVSAAGKFGRQPDLDNFPQRLCAEQVAA